MTNIITVASIFDGFGLSNLAKLEYPSVMITMAVL
jgi:hypothetical protein